MVNAHIASVADELGRCLLQQRFERITRANLAVLPHSAEVVLELDDNHDCIQSIYS